VSALSVALMLLATGVSFTVSASAGLGGSLVLVPALALVLGTKEGVALAALLLAANNVVKVVAYRDVLPLCAAALLLPCMVVGAALGASALVAAPTRLVTIAVLAMFAGSLLAERLGESRRLGRAGPPALAFASGATSGFSGTSGPLKGVAVKRLALDRRHTVGAASLLSLFGDVAKASVYAEASLLGGQEALLALAALPLMLAATAAGRALNGSLSERHYDVFFWSVMGGYSVRLLAA
jgi:uncharacterized protein